MFPDTYSQYDEQIAILKYFSPAWTEPHQWAEFIRHSAEQSVLSLLALKYSIPLHRCPDQGGWPVAWDGKYKPEDTYPQLFHHDGWAHRGKETGGGSRYRNV